MTWLRAAAATALTVVTALLGGWDLALQALLFFIAADYLTALFRALFTGKADSSVGLRGFVKKLALLLGVAVAHGLDLYVFSVQDPWARTLAAMVFTLNEAVSTVANLSAIGVPLPDVITKALETEIRRKRGDPA